MKEMRQLGNMIQKLIQEKNIKSKEITNLLNCNLEQLENIYKGRIFLSFNQLDMLANFLNVSIDTLLNGNIEYDETKGVEKVLDIIDDYLRLKNAVET